MDALIERLKERIQNKELTPATIPPPATLAEVEAAERVLGFNFPTLLRRIYLEVANGGFGPDYGLLGVPPDGTTDDQGGTILSLYGTLPLNNPDIPYEGEDDYEFLEWPEKLLPICHYGCAIYACFDCEGEDGAIVIWEGGLLDSLPEANSLQEWLENWLNKE